MISPILDWWILPHLGIFIWLGSFVANKWPRASWWIHVVWVLALSYGWEIAEFFLQRAYPHLWADVIECGMNAWCVDPLTNLAGGLIGVAVGKWSQGRRLKT
jgi:hypothetical protein